MTKKDYELIASVLQNKVANVYYTGIISNIAYDFASKLEKENPRFDREKFLKACGL